MAILVQTHARPGRSTPKLAVTSMLLLRARNFYSCVIFQRSQRAHSLRFQNQLDDIPHPPPTRLGSAPSSKNLSGHGQVKFFENALSLLLLILTFLQRLSKPDLRRRVLSQREPKSDERILPSSAHSARSLSPPTPIAKTIKTKRAQHWSIMLGKTGGFHALFG